MSLWKRTRTHPPQADSHAEGGDPRDRRAFLRQAKELVADLPIPVPFTTDAWIAGYSAFRGRRIVPQPWPIRAYLRRSALEGFLLAQGDHDVLYYERDTRLQHQQIIILHECGHDLLGHPGVPLPEEIREQLRLPTAGPPPRAHCRGPEESWQEFQAETIARLIVLRAGSPTAEVAATDARDRLADLTEYLEGMTGA